MQVCDDHGRAAAMGDHAPGTIGSSALRRSALCEGVDLLMDVALVTCVSATGNANGEGHARTTGLPVCLNDVACQECAARLNVLG